MSSRQLLEIKTRLQLALCCSTIILTTAPQIAFAQMVLEEVVVTARKRVESLQDTPIAVSAFNNDGLRQARIESIGDLTQNVPGLSRREGDKNAALNIRGISTRAAGVTAEPGVGVYVDSIYIPRNDTQLVDILQAESVQVLRGPQGTLFGKNTAGGAILLTTKKPGEEVSGFARADVGDLDRQNLSFGISGPVGGGLSAGIQVDSRSEDGFREDAITGVEYGDVDRQSVLGQLHYEGDTFVGDMFLFRGEVKENINPANCLQVNPAAPLQNFTAPGDVEGYGASCTRSWDLLDDDKVLLDESVKKYEVTNTLAGLTMAWDLEPFTAKSITGYLYQDDLNVGSGNIDGSNVFYLGNMTEVRRQMSANGINPDEETREFFSQEFQLVGDAFGDTMAYTLGVFYSKEKIEDSPGGQMLGPGGWIGFNAGEGLVQLGPTSIGFREAIIRDFDNTSAAVFGQTILSLSDMWQLTLGARYTWEEKEAEQVNYTTGTTLSGIVTKAEFDALADYIHPVVVNADNPSSYGKDDWSQFSPAATLTMFIPDTWTDGSLSGGMVYTSASQGFKAGGFAPFGQEFLPFDPEDVWTYELGYKLEFWDSRVRLNGAFYYSDYSDIQINVTRAFPNEDPSLPPQVLNGITNAGKAIITGAEFELLFMPVDGLLLSANASFIDAEYDEFEDEATLPDGTVIAIDRSDEAFAFTPEETISLAANYDWSTEVGTISPRLSYFYRSSLFIGLDPLSAQTPESYLDSYEIWNARVAFRPTDVEGLEVAAYVNNLADEEYFGSGIASLGGVGALALIPGKQRTYGVEVRYDW